MGSGGQSDDSGGGDSHQHSYDKETDHGSFHSHYDKGHTKDQTGFSVHTSDVEVPVSDTTTIKGSGPSVDANIIHSDTQTGFNFGAQYGGGSISHETENHKVELGLSEGIGFGAHVNHDEGRYGVGGSVGPVTFETAFKPPEISEETVDTVVKMM